MALVTIYPVTAVETTAGVDPTNLSYPPGDVRRYGAALNDVDDDSEAFTDALKTHGIDPWDGTAYLEESLLFQNDGTTMRGKGGRSVVRYEGSSVAIGFNGKKHCRLEGVRVLAPNASSGVYVGDVCPWSTVTGCDIRGSSTYNDLSGAISPGAGITLESTFYADITNNDISSWTRGVFGLDECNGNFITNNSIRRCARGVHLSDANGNSDGCQIANNEIEGGESGDLYGIEIEGSSNMMVAHNRIEYSPNGTAHIYIHEGEGIALRHSLFDNHCVGTIPSLKIGDDSGSHRVQVTEIVGGYYANTITIGVDCDFTSLDLSSNRAIAGGGNPPANHSTTSILSLLNDQTFTVGITGLSTSPTANWLYTISKNVVTIEATTLNGTSNSASCTITGLPTLIRPVSSQTAYVLVQDNGTTVVSKGVVDSSGVITLSPTANGGAFTNSGSKGLIACTITYSLSR